MRHKKWGFGVPWVEDVQTEADLRQRLFDVSQLEPVRTLMGVNPQKVEAIIREFLNGDDQPAKLVQRLFMVSIWYEVYMIESASQPEFVSVVPAPRSGFISSCKVPAWPGAGRKEIKGVEDGREKR